MNSNSDVKALLEKLLGEYSETEIMQLIAFASGYEEGKKRQILNHSDHGHQQPDSK